MVYVDAPSIVSNDTNIFVRYSDDNGATWSAPIRVNDDATTKSQFNPAVAVDETTGDVAVTWYDARNSPGDNTTQIFGTVSDNGGLSFLANVLISAGTSDASLVDPGFDYGDYDLRQWHVLAHLGRQLQQYRRQPERDKRIGHLHR